MQLELEKEMKMRAVKRFKTQEKSIWQGVRKKSEEKKQKSVLRKKLQLRHLKVILILLLRNMSSEIIHADVVVNEINDKMSSISSQIAEQIEVILEVVL